MQELDKNRTERNRFTRMCIGEAILVLMQEQEFDRITVSGIARKAGISRMTFYHYYDSAVDALRDYLNEMVACYLREREEQTEIGSFHEYSNILFSLTFFDRYASFFMRMAQAGQYSVIINAINDFMLKQFGERYQNSIYELYYYSGALLNTFMKWEEGGKKESAEEIAAIICRFVGNVS